MIIKRSSWEDVLAAVSPAVWFDLFLTVLYERLTIARRADIETADIETTVGSLRRPLASRNNPTSADAAERRPSEEREIEDKRANPR